MWKWMTQQQQRGAQLPPRQPAREAHADGEKGKPTARDASGRKQPGYARGEDEDQGKADEGAVPLGS